MRIDELSIKINSEISKYSREVAKQIKAAAKEVAEETKEELRETSPEDTGAYKKGWAVKPMYETEDNIRVAIANTKFPYLTHLLEYGHAKVNGGRVDARPHIRPAEQKAIKQFESKVEKIVKG